VTKPRLSYRLAPDGPEETVEIDRELTVGRRSSNALRLKHRSVSRYHSRVENREGTCYLVDLSSRNGSRINGEPVVGAHPLRDGDVIAIGKFELRFETGRQPALAAAPEHAVRHIRPSRSPAARRRSKQVAFWTIVLSVMLMAASIPLWIAELKGGGGPRWSVMYDLSRHGTGDWCAPSSGDGALPPGNELGMDRLRPVRWILTGTSLPDRFRIEGTISAFQGSGRLLLSTEPDGASVQFRRETATLVAPGGVSQSLPVRYPLAWSLERDHDTVLLRAGDLLSRLPAEPADGARASSSGSCTTTASRSSPP